MATLVVSAVAGVLTLGMLVPAVAASAAEPESTKPVVMDEIEPGTPIIDGRTGQVRSRDGSRCQLGTVGRGTTDTPEFEGRFASFAPAIKDSCRTPPQITSEDMP